ncbi:MAG: hydrogenase maturation nickel metallochaperone HypA [Eubacterium sp.]
MHELSLVMEIFDLLDEISEEQGLKKVKSVTLEAGELCGIIPEYMEECWRVAGQDSPYESTELRLIKIPATALCSCGAEYEMTKNSRICPVCHKTDYTVIHGREFNIREIEAC